jgi:DNA-binding MarR family transcriptional regulator
MNTAASATPLVDALGGLFCNVNRLSQHDLLTAVDEHDLSITQVKVLFALDRRGPQTPGAIARELPLSPAATSRACDGLHRLGFVERSEDEHDRRVRHLALTAAGAGFVDRLRRTRTDLIERVSALLDADEQARLAAALAPLVERSERLAREGRTQTDGVA